MITAHEIAKIRQTFAACLPRTDDVAADFYARLFVVLPEARHLFVGDMADQGRKLVMTLATIVDGLDRLDDILPTARELAIRHVGYGVAERHYAYVGAVLIDTLRDTLGGAFDAEAHAAWTKAYAMLADVMIDAARGRA